MLRPPNGALTWPSSELPVPNATMGASWRAQRFTASTTSSTGLREQHRVGRGVRYPGRGVAVLLAQRLRRNDTVSEMGGEIGGERGDGRGSDSRLAATDGQGHGRFLRLSGYTQPAARRNRWRLSAIAG